VKLKARCLLREREVEKKEWAAEEVTVLNVIAKNAH